MAKKQKYYVVWRGRVPGIYTDWETAKAQIEHFEDARFKGYESEVEAQEAFAAGPPKVPAYILASKREKSGLPPTEKPLLRAIAVDAACSGNPGVMEYRGVSLWDNKEIFHCKHELGTNNIGEFLAIVHCMALLQKKGAEDITIYSDSKIAMSWVRNGKCRTKLEFTPRTAELLSIVQRAEKWLASNSFRVPLVKWPTEVWGEIPADFGRK
ncbi:MAG: ribonuclease H family protein [Bacteroidia bacterium]|nr:ribonuclease H family protein [Bacteroidia bacterium]